jgi:hypothetical protein
MKASTRWAFFTWVESISRVEQRLDRVAVTAMVDSWLQSRKLMLRTVMRTWSFAIAIVSPFERSPCLRISVFISLRSPSTTRFGVDRVVCRAVGVHYCLFSRARCVIPTRYLGQPERLAGPCCFFSKFSLVLLHTCSM